ncbi:putative PEP-binding protein [Streptomyces sp. HUAS ZL42]|uniref:putative PEP-binding protein n=1 Tax=Streptomyces sp. HUAS ZL42 TaxID=3231715 RepID=UPI00345E8F63
MSAPSTTMAGYGVSPELACAPLIRMMPPLVTDPDEAPDDDPGHEVQPIRQALTKVAEQLSTIATGGTADVILETGAAMASDPALIRASARHISEGVPTAHSLPLAVDSYRSELDSLDCSMAERATDLRALRNCAVAILLDAPMPGVPHPGHPFILAAADLFPVDTTVLADSEAVGPLTERSSPTSHTAISAHSLGLPAVVGCAEAAVLPDGTPVILDGRAGTLEAHPSFERRQQDLEQDRSRRLRRLHGPGRNADQHSISILTNIGTPGDAPRTAEDDNEGVGLCRTEFLYLDRHEAPTIDEQIDACTKVFTAFKGRALTTRTLDAGPDKPLPFLQMSAEDNPALGIRGLRTSTIAPSIFMIQLKALVAAQQNSGGQMRVMAPTVSTAQEAAQFAELPRGYEVHSVGIMIVVPSAALLAHELLQHVDFASIGTNDLAQYTLAADRTTHNLSHLLAPWRPARLTRTAQVCSAAPVIGRPVGVCGEAAADPLLAPVLAGTGVSSLSTASPAVAPVRDPLARLTLQHCEDLAAARVHEGTRYRTRHHTADE